MLLYQQCRLFGVVVLALIMFHRYVEAVPGQVILLRAAEKPNEKQSPSLSTKGYQRARALVPYLLETPEFTEKGLPVAIYAQNPENLGDSNRPKETVEPLAHRLNLGINKNFTQNQYLAMVNEILTQPAYNGKNVVISWGQSVMSEIAKALGATKAPKEWSHEHDYVWLLTFNNDGSVDFSEIPQKLLYGDSSGSVTGKVKSFVKSIFK